MTLPIPSHPGTDDDLDDDDIDEPTPLYVELGDPVAQAMPCGDCGGSGVDPVSGSVCWDCRGTGTRLEFLSALTCLLGSEYTPHGFNLLTEDLPS